MNGQIVSSGVSSHTGLSATPERWVYTDVQKSPTSVVTFEDDHTSLGKSAKTCTNASARYKYSQFNDSIVYNPPPAEQKNSSTNRIQSNNHYIEQSIYTSKQQNNLQEQLGHHSYNSLVTSGKQSGLTEAHTSFVPAPVPVSLLRNPSLAPPPKFSERYIELVYARISSEGQSMKSGLPSLQLVNHSGTILARFSIASKLINKKWKQYFWIIYGTHQLYFFSSKQDFEEWLFNPFLSKRERDGLVKFGAEFKGNVRYGATSMKTKIYRDQGALHNFKLEKWLDNSASFAAAFANKKNENIQVFRTLITEMIKGADSGRGMPHDLGSRCWSTTSTVNLNTSW